jgi:hypothetical protein
MIPLELVEPSLELPPSDGEATGVHRARRGGWRRRQRRRPGKGIEVSAPNRGEGLTKIKQRNYFHLTLEYGAGNRERSIGAGGAAACWRSRRRRAAAMIAAARRRRGFSRRPFQARVGGGCARSILARVFLFRGNNSCSWNRIANSNLGLI